MDNSPIAICRKGIKINDIYRFFNLKILSFDLFTPQNMGEGGQLYHTLDSFIPRYKKVGINEMLSTKKVVKCVVIFMKILLWEKSKFFFLMCVFTYKMKHE